MVLVCDVLLCQHVCIKTLMMEVSEELCVKRYSKMRYS